VKAKVKLVKIGVTGTIPKSLRKYPKIYKKRMKLRNYKKQPY
jgi:hypothetical protein